jgi:hypothetical protein
LFNAPSSPDSAAHLLRWRKFGACSSDVGGSRRRACGFGVADWSANQAGFSADCTSEHRSQ